MSATAIHTPVFLQPASGDAAISYTAQEWRQYTRAAMAAVDGVDSAPGVTAASYQVVQRAAGANLSVDVGAGLAYVVGADVTSQGPYMCWNDGTVNVTGWTVPGSGTLNHRLVLQVQDKLSNGAWSGYTAALTALLDTGSGTPAEPASAITLAVIQVAAGQASILNANITDYRQRVGPVAAVKTSDLARTHATTPTNDPGLQLLNLAASASYEVAGMLRYNGGSGAGEGDFQWQFTTGAGASGGYADTHNSTGGSYGWEKFTTWTTAGRTAGTEGTSTDLDIMILGLLVTGGVPPQSLILQWSQNTDTGTATTLKANSYLRARRIA